MRVMRHAHFLSRSAYTVFYYSKLKVLGPVVFTVSMLSLTSLLVIGVMA